MTSVSTRPAFGLKRARRRYDPASLVDISRHSRYWRKGGCFLPGAIAQLLGMVASAMWIGSSAFVGPLSRGAGGSDFSVFTGLGVAAVVYWLLARRQVEGESAVIELRTGSEAQVPLMSGV